MNPLSIALLALAMSTDAFAAAIGKGAALHRPELREALRTGAIFGTIEAITKLVKMLGGEVVKIVFLMELQGLKGRDRLKGYNVEAVIEYEGK